VIVIFFWFKAEKSNSTDLDSMGSANSKAEKSNSTDLDSMGSANSKAEKSKLRFHKEAFRTLLCGHLIPDLAGIALDYFWVLMFVRSIHLALSFCVILAASVEGLVVYGVILGSRTMDGDVLLTFFAKKQNNICM
jgi:hypothetical protein